MADGSELPVGEYRIMPTEEPRKYVMAVKLSTKVINHLQKGTHRAASICFGKENKFIVDNEQYTFTVQQEDKMVQDCYYQCSDLLAEIGGVRKKLFFTQELTGEDRSRIKENSRQAEEKFRNHKSIVLPADGKTKNKGTKTTKVSKRIVTAPKHSRLVVPTPQARTPPQPSTPPLSARPPSQPRPSTPPPPTAAVPIQTLPATPLSPPLSTPPQGPILSPPQPQQQQKVLSPPLMTPPLLSKPKSGGRTRSAPTPALTLTPALKEPTNAPPPKFPLRTHLIHDIALQPRTVAKLAEMHNVTNNEITQLLPSFAKYNPPGLWYPKNEMFQEVDPEWHEYSPEDREVVREKRNEALANLAASPPAPVEDKTLASATKNLKNIIPMDPSEMRKKPRIDRPPASSNPPPPASITSASSSTTATLTPPLVSNELSPTLDLSPTSGDPPSSVKKRTRESPASTLPNSKIAKTNPPPELLSPPLTSIPSSTPASSSKPRKPPHSALKPPASLASPIPTPTSSPFVTPMAKSKPTKPTPSPIPTPTKSPIPPPTKSTPPTKPPASKPSPTPAPLVTTPIPPKPTKATAKPTTSSTRQPAPPSKSAPKPTSSKPTSSTSKARPESEFGSVPEMVPALKPIPPPPKFNIVITNPQDNERYRKTYGEKYAIYLELHRKLTENRDVFVRFDKEWKTSDVEGRKALSAKIESTYRECCAEVERVQAEHSALHAELIAIKDAMKRYLDSARTQGANADANARSKGEQSRAKQPTSQQKQLPPPPNQTQKSTQKKPSPPPSQGLPPPSKSQQSSQKQSTTQKTAPPKTSSSSSASTTTTTTTTSSQQVQSLQKPKQPRRQPPTQKHKSVATKS